MEQKHPRSLITDGDAAMAKAIEIVMPEADHRLCSWHIEQNMIKRLRGKALKDFRKLIYHAVDADEFERQWVQFNANHTFKEENKLWLVRLYEREIFFGYAEQSAEQESQFKASQPSGPEDVAY
uniref:MULE transposase domain-containing protein n=1 Tax=Arundo donax TaxID=35708 RepID=A0A0A9HK95_ARUDO